MRHNDLDKGTVVQPEKGAPTTIGELLEAGQSWEDIHSGLANGTLTIPSQEIKQLDTGLFVREGTDHELISKANLAMVSAIDIREGETFLDIGAHIGVVSALAKEFRGAGAVIAVEPMEDTGDVLAKNAEFFGFEAVQAAVVPGDEEEIDIYVAKNHFGSRSCVPSLLASDSRVKHTVPAVNFRELLGKVKPDVMKVDIEGAEATLDWSELPDNLRCLVIEFHTFRKAVKDSVGWIQQILVEQGFSEYHRSMTETTEGWTNQIFLRRTV
ncbi:MAG: hypothetical protein CMJ75_18800 [Planctomycetaceae bacterium]|nr:hypothetical protein [Planctomycetaceae bacterium]